MVLLHISAATDALEAKQPDDPSLRRLVETTAEWTKMVSHVGRRMQYNVQTALPIT